MRCVFCERASSSYFKVCKTDAAGVERGKPIYVCSILCLIRWAYGYTTKRGIESVQAVRDAVGRLVGGTKKR